MHLSSSQINIIYFRRTEGLNMNIPTRYNPNLFRKSLPEKMLHQ